jgi:hypothetical protein
MPALASDLRKTLENTVVKARDKAEGGARDALTALAVDASEPFGSMGDEERKLRNRLRARGRQLGDQRDPQKGSQGIERLVREMAYEHWHRMLFARFLAENQLLIEPTSGVAISLDECEELAAEEVADLWGLAAQFAQSMLPQIFRVDDPVLEAKLPLEIRQQLQGLVAELETETFTASDSLGWTYQFWQTKRKKEVNDSGVKIGADEISPVTQLFTEDYMVDFLLDNTLGAWHAGKALAANPQLAETAQSEEELRQAVALPGCAWSYLRFVKSDDGPWAPAAGAFEGWPKTAAELKCLDPCMGSGHFVVAMFERLVALRLAEESVVEAAAVSAVIQDNLFGLEIDPRCTQIGAFNLAMAAWRHVGYCKLPAMNLACSGLAPNTRETDWLALADDNDRLRNGMVRLYRLFEKASVLGSLINPRNTEADLLAAGFQELQPLLENVLAQETRDDTGHEMAATARGLAKAAEILASKFTLVATNVPFLKRGYQGKELSDWIENHYESGKANIATAMLMRANEMAMPGGSIALVIQQSWLYQTTQRRLREQVLENFYWNSLARLGPGAFNTISGEVVNVALATLTRQVKSNPAVAGVDAYSDKGSEAKANRLREGSLDLLDQAAQSKNPQGIVRFPGGVNGSKLIGEFCDLGKGSVTGDAPHFVRQFWEQPLTPGWQPWLNTPDTALFSGRQQVVLWEKDGEAVRLEKGARIHGQNVWGRRGLLVGKTSFSVGIYLGEMFDDNTGVLAPASESELTALLCFSSSDEFEASIRDVDQELKVTIGNFGKITIDLDHWSAAAAQKYPICSPKPFSSDPTQWLFNGHPVGADQLLHVAVARLIGYLWPRQTGSSFPDCPALDPDGLESLADQDGIVCLTPVRGEAAAADRLRGLLAAALGDEWSNAKERELLLETAAANNAKSAAACLSDWLRQNFFVEHCKLFQSRPSIWQIWDGNPHGFSALVNYHKLAAPHGQGRKTLELLTYTYLGDWIDRQKLDQAEGINGADDRLAAALDLKVQLKKILEGEPPYDIFVRWKPLHQQAIGWDPDINDGVRLNIRPFLSAQLRKGGKTGAGILRAKPGTIKWAKDRGKESMRSKDDFPWFSGWDENSPALATDFGAPVPEAPPAGDSFDGNRWNDLHYTRAAKEAARARHRGEG